MLVFVGQVLRHAHDCIDGVQRGGIFSTLRTLFCEFLNISRGKVSLYRNVWRLQSCSFSLQGVNT